MDSRPVILIDFSALFRRAWHVVSEVSHAFESTVAGVNRASNLLPNSLVAVCCDGRGNWRKSIAPTYKAQREQQPAQMYGEMDRTLDRLRKDGRLIWKFDGFEADDVIASACMMARTRGHEVRIVSHDKDLLQLLGPGVDYMAIHVTPWALKTHSDVIDKYGVETTQLGDWLALKGDSSDNIKGCPGVGDKTATELLRKFGNLAEIFKASIGEPEKPLTPNICKNMLAFKDQIETARKLVTLSREVPIRFDEIYEEREIRDIDERDSMSEAENEAAKEFDLISDDSGDNGNSPDVATTAVATAEQGCSTDPDKGQAVGLTPSPDPSAPVQRDKTPEEIAEVSRPIETALVPIVEYTRQLEPRSMREASVYSDLMYHSRVYSRYPTKQSILAAIVRGRELGFGAGASIDMFHVADFRNDGNLRLLMHAHAIIDLAMGDPSLEYFMLTESTETQATYEAKVKRNPKPTTITYTIEDAKKAGLVKPNSNWEKRPKEQLRKTAGCQLARVVSPGRAIGLYSFEEMGIDNE